ncbi:MAG: rRNA pseudouridine synthase [Chitinophagaceae bacterium]|nr:rRNA pseudouridine synthase [Chitinophagaceae bacterium]
MKKTNNFEKFEKKKSNAAVKEQFRQEKRKWKKEKEVAIEKRKIEKRAAKDITKAPKRNIPTVAKPASEQMPLNKYVAHAGVCARRDAAQLVKEGHVKVNGELITEPGFKVTAKDEVRVKDKKVSLVKDLVYILVNKPKNYITTTEDPQGRKTVLDLIKKATNERVFPIGRLDRNTSGVLLLTNDGDLSQQLTHPSNQVKKIYSVVLDKPLTKDHFEQILRGITLDDGPAHVDVMAYTDPKDKTMIGVELHGGRNRIVRRLFEHFGYDVKTLDRVVFAGLTKKNLQRGHWRHLTDKELRELKFFGKGK